MARNDFSSNYLMHYGVLGMKWGIRRYQNPDGSLTAAGAARYRRDSVPHNIGRAVLNGELGQRIAVNLNKGYRADKKEIKGLYKEKKAELKAKRTDSNKEKINAELKSLKSDYKKTKAEARTTAAQVNYQWQGDKANEKIQSQALGWPILRKVLMGGFGGKVYSEVYEKTGSRGAAVIDGVLATLGNAFFQGAGSIGEYAFRKTTKQDKVDKDAVKAEYKKEKEAKKAADKKIVNETKEYNSVNEMFADLKKQRESQPPKSNREKLKDVEKLIKDSNWKQNKDGTWDWNGDPNASEGTKDHDFDAFINILDEKRELEEKVKKNR